MRKTILILLALVVFANCPSIFAQETDQTALELELHRLKRNQIELRSSNMVLEQRIKALETRMSSQSQTIDSLQKEMVLTRGVVESNKIQLGEEIKTANQDIAVTRANTEQELRQHALYATAGFLIALFVALALYLLLRKRMSKGTETMDELFAMQDKLQEESMRLDSKLLSLFDNKPLAPSEEGDHSFAMKVADEVVRIEMNLYRMDKNTKGYKQLSKAVERIKNNFMAQGYELVDLIGQPYDDGMRINADFVIDETLPEGTRVITSVTKPQINYMGKLIQKAIVTVSQNI